MDKYKLSIVFNKEVSKETLISDLKHFTDAFEHSQNTAFEYVTDSAIFKVERTNDSEIQYRTQFVDAACHAI